MKYKFLLLLSVLVCGCTKHPEPESYTAPEFGEMTAVPELHSAQLSCQMTSVNGITACGVYLYDADQQESKWSGELSGNTIVATVTDLYRNTTYKYKFFMVNGELEVVSDTEATFTTLYDGPELKCDYIDEWGINHGKGLILGTTVWAPVNCGTHETDYSFGKFYQWGRKNGLGGNGYDSGEVTVAPQWTGANGQEDANTFYNTAAGGTFDRDWIKDGSASFWNAGTEDNPIKSEFDPCPAGWRVPTGKELDYLYSKNIIPSMGEYNGYWFQYENEYVWLPAGGSYGEDTQYGNRGQKAFYWSSLAHHSLYFHFSLIKTQECQLMEAQNIRCVQE